MIDNFLEGDYHSYDQVYLNEDTNTSLYIGDVQAALDLPFLQTNNIRTVVTAAKDMDQVSFDLDITHVVYPLLDAKNQDITNFFESFYQLIRNNLAKGSILVHCAAGISRSSTLVISYLMKKLNMSFKDAIAYVRKSRPSVLPNLGFERQLKKYEEALKRASKSSSHSRRNQVKTSQSGKSQQLLLFKTELLPALGATVKLRQQPKLVNFNIKNLIDKIGDKEFPGLKSYNNSRNQSKQKKFVITKKSTSFTKHKEERGITTSHMPIEGYGYFSNKIEREKPRKLKTPLDQMKSIYLSKKSNTFLQAKHPTERGTSFFNLRAKQKIQS